MKKITTLLLSASLVLGVLALTACQQKEAGRYYYSDEYNFSIKVPDTWNTSEGLMGTNLAILSPLEGKDDAFSDNITIIIQELPMTMDLDEYFEAGKASSASILDNYTELEHEKIQLDNKETIEYTYTYTMGGQDLKGIAYIFLDGTISYLINGSSTASGFDEYVDAFKETAKSFRSE